MFWDSLGRSLVSRLTSCWKQLLISHLFMLNYEGGIKILGKDGLIVSKAPLEHVLYTVQIRVAGQTTEPNNNKPI